MDFEVMYRAMDSRDRRFDGRFFVAVTSTGIYCRPICPAPSPKPSNTRFFRFAAMAELAGFRPCRRCRPEVSPDTEEWDTRSDLVGRGLRLIADGVVDEIGVAGMAGKLGVSERHLQRTFTTEIGTTPGVIARSRRARLARQLLTETGTPITMVAFSAGFASVRAFNDAMRQIYRVTPTELRRGVPSAAIGLVTMELPFRPPLAARELLTFLGRRAIPGVEEVTDESYRRSVRFGTGHAIVELRISGSVALLTIDTKQTAPLAPLVQGARRLFDLDADPEAIDQHLRRSPQLRSLIDDAPGIRLAGTMNPFETGVLAILEHRSTPAAAARLAGRIAGGWGTPINPVSGTITHLFPDPGQLRDADLGLLGISERRRVAIAALAAAVLSSDVMLDGSAHPDDSTAQLLALPGIGPRTASVIATRVLRDPDACPLADISLNRAYQALESGSRAPLAEISQEWRPWRGYAAMHLWSMEGEVSA